MPVLRFASVAAYRRAVTVLRDQHFEVIEESVMEIGVRPWCDLAEAEVLLDAERIAWQRAERAVVRRGRPTVAR